MKNSVISNPDEAVIVALGGNMPGAHGCSPALLEAALAQFDAHGLRVVARSGWWRSAAWPDPAQPAYTNGVAIVETGLGPVAVMAALHALELEFGRMRGAANASRTLDLDLVAYGREVLVFEGVELPHPRAAERLFVMGPLSEVAPGWRHPVTGKSALTLAAKATVGADAAPIPPLHGEGQTGEARQGGVTDMRPSTSEGEAPA